MVTALVYEVANDEDIACKLMVDLYGNYVFQKALSIAKNEYYMQLLKVIIFFKKYFSVWLIM